MWSAKTSGPTIFGLFHFLASLLLLSHCCFYSFGFFENWEVIKNWITKSLDHLESWILGILIFLVKPLLISLKSEFWTFTLLSLNSTIANLNSLQSSRKRFYYLSAWKFRFGGVLRLSASAFIGHKLRESAGKRLIFSRLIIILITHNISKI